METTQVLLTLRGVSKSFPGVKALDAVDFDLRRGEVHALVGENGAGKSTLMKILSGVYKKDAGQIMLEGDAVEVRDVSQARALGISIIFQELSQVPQLTVAQNIFLGEEPRGFLGALNDRSLTRRAADLLQEYQINLDPLALIECLSPAERQLAEIAKAISLGSRILIMDEPTSSLTLTETENLFAIVDSLRGRGVGIIYVSHRMNEITRLADRVTILRDGKNVGTFDVDQVSIDEVVRLMVGHELEDTTYTHPPTPAGTLGRVWEPVLEVIGLSREAALHNITFDLHRGEILGVAGLVGSGRSELARAIFGIDAFEAGEIRIGGEKVRIKTPGDAVGAGIALIPEDRRLQGLVMQHTVEQNIMLPLLRDNSRRGVVPRAACRRITQEAIQRLRIRPADPERVVHFLSGGNQQKVVLAKWLASEPKVLIVDEPTAGIDVGAKAEIHQLMRQLAASGVGILLISSDIPEILALSDRLLVMYGGSIRGEFTRGEATQEKIMAKIMESAIDQGGGCA